MNTSIPEDFRPLDIPRTTGSEKRDLGCLLRCLWYYYSWVPVLKWLTLITLGIVITVLILGGVFMSGHNFRIFAPVVVLTGVVFTAGFPFVTSSIAFRKLASNRPYMLAPGSGYIAALALLLNMLLIGLTCFLLIWLLSNQAPYRALMLFLIFASLYLGLTQLDLPPWTMMFVGWLPILLINSARFLPQSLTNFLLSGPVLTTLLIVVSLGWWTGLNYMRSGRILKPLRYTSRNMRTELGAWDLSMQPEWLRLIQSKTFSSAADSLFHNMMMNLGTRIRRLSVPAVVVLAIVLGMFSLRSPQNGSDVFLYIVVLMTASMSVFGAVEMFPRCKLLWLRCGNNRRHIWNIVENNMFLDWVVILSLSAILCVFIGLMYELKPVLIFKVLVTISCSMPLFTYIPLYFKQKSSGISIFLTMISLTFVAGLMVTTSLTFLYTNQLMPVAVLDVTFILAALAIRYAARKRFDTVDWMELKPKRISGMRNAG